VVLPCHALGVVELVQEEKTQSTVQNPRFILMPVWHDRMGELERAADLPSRIKEEIEQFFTSATFFTGKKAKVMGWHGPKAADKLINASDERTPSSDSAISSHYHALECNAIRTVRRAALLRRQKKLRRVKLACGC
jgi:Inorganic pyrophosphatase